jgi:hypothetical protein
MFNYATSVNTCFIRKPFYLPFSVLNTISPILFRLLIHRKKCTSGFHLSHLFFNFSIIRFILEKTLSLFSYRANLNVYIVSTCSCRVELSPCILSKPTSSKAAICKVCLYRTYLDVNVLWFCRASRGSPTKTAKSAQRAVPGLLGCPD